MFTITITTQVEDGPETEYRALPGQKEEDGSQKYGPVPTGRQRKATVEVYKQQLESIDIQEIILAINQPHVINRSGNHSANPRVQVLTPPTPATETEIPF